MDVDGSKIALLKEGHETKIIEHQLIPTKSDWKQVSDYFLRVESPLNPQNLMVIIKITSACAYPKVNPLVSSFREAFQKCVEFRDIAWMLKVGMGFISKTLNM